MLLIFFFNDPATTEIYTLSLHDALPISPNARASCRLHPCRRTPAANPAASSAPSPCRPPSTPTRSEEHTSELQSHSDLVCRLLLEKKKNTVRLLSIDCRDSHAHVMCVRR